MDPANLVKQLQEEGKSNDYIIVFLEVMMDDPTLQEKERQVALAELRKLRELN